VRKRGKIKNICILTIFILVISTIAATSNLIQIKTESGNYFDEECTAVIVTGKAAKDGRAILMKNRDTSDTMNKPVYYPPRDGKYGYIMVNHVWMGINEKGLAVMNTQVSALAFGGSGLDNGALNRWIIENCETVEEVCQALNDTSSPIGPGKRQGGTCIGVIDRFGNGAFIEVSGIGAYARFIVDGFDSQANHPRCYPGYASGPIGRDKYALDILNAIYAEKGYISWEDVAQNVSRYVRNKEKGTSSFSISGEVCNTNTQAAMVAISGDPRYDGKLNCMWGEYGNPPMVGLFVPSIPFAGQPPPILNSFWNYVWQKRSYTQDQNGYYIPSKVREVQDYTFFAEDYTFIKYDMLMASIPDNLSDAELKSILQEYVESSVEAAAQIYLAEPEVLTHTLTYNGKTYQAKTVSNSTISNFQFASSPNIKISFTATGEPSTTGFCYAALPKELFHGTLTITINGTQHTATNPVYNDYVTILNLTYTHPSQITVTAYVYPTYYFEDDFESANLNAWSDLTITSGAYASISNRKTYVGSYSAKFETEPIESGTRRACVYKNIGESPVVYARGYFYIDEGLPLIDNDDRFTFIQFLNSKGAIMAGLQIRRVQGEDRFTLYAYNNIRTTTAIYPQPKTWYCLELYIKINPTEGAVKAYINGMEQISYTNINTTSLGNVAIIRFGLANSINTQQKVTVYLDSAIISTTYNGPRPFPRWDINQDGIVDMYDVSIVCFSFGSTPQSSNWNPAADINSDEHIDIRDVVIVAMHYGEQYT
jgi:hypothetical protein